MIQRWKIYGDQAAAVTEPDGDYVEYEDHLAAIAEKDREIERLKAALNEIAMTELICPEMKEKCEYMSDIALKALKEDSDATNNV